MYFGMILYKFNKKFKIQYSKKILIVENIKLIFNSIIVAIVVKNIKLILPEINIFISILVYGMATLILYVVILIILKSKAIKIKL